MTHDALRAEGAIRGAALRQLGICGAQDGPVCSAVRRSVSVALPRLLVGAPPREALLGGRVGGCTAQVRFVLARDRSSGRSAGDTRDDYLDRRPIGDIDNYEPPFAAASRRRARARLGIGPVLPRIDDCQRSAARDRTRLDPDSAG